jgi:hypothetical protein
MIAGYQRNVARGGIPVCVAVSVRLLEGLSGPYTPAGWLPYILLILPLPPILFPVPSRPRNAHDFLSSSPSHPVST